MRILFVCDEEDKGLYDYFDPSRLEGVDLIISCGDLSPEYLEFLETMSCLPLLYIRGNHDRGYSRRPPQGCKAIDDRIYDFHGLRILGLGGSMRYKEGTDMYTEEEMKRRINKLRPSIFLHNGFDLLVTHAPSKGYGDMDDLPHKGFACFNDLLLRCRPKYMVHGHVHKSYGTGFKRVLMHPSGTAVINAYPSYYLDISDEDHPAHGQTGSALYDFYVGMVERRKRKR